MRHPGMGIYIRFAESSMEAQAGGQQKTQVQVIWMVWFGFLLPNASQHLVLNEQGRLQETWDTNFHSESLLAPLHPFY